MIEATTQLKDENEAKLFSEFLARVLAYRASSVAVVAQTEAEKTRAAQTELPLAATNTAATPAISTTASPAANITPPSAAPVTEQAVVERLRAYVNSKGIGPAREILSAAGANRVADLQMDKYAEVFAKLALS